MADVDRGKRRQLGPQPAAAWHGPGVDEQSPRRSDAWNHGYRQQSYSGAQQWVVVYSGRVSLVDPYDPGTAQLGDTACEAGELRELLALFAGDLERLASRMPELVRVLPSRVRRRLFEP